MIKKGETELFRRFSDRADLGEGVLKAGLSRAFAVAEVGDRHVLHAEEFAFRKLSFGIGGQSRQRHVSRRTGETVFVENLLHLFHGDRAAGGLHALISHGGDLADRAFEILCQVVADRVKLQSYG